MESVRQHVHRIVERSLPMSPKEALEFLAINPGTKTQLALSDFDLFVFAFFVLAPCTATGCDLCQVE
jgi:hypothetical protein